MRIDNSTASDWFFCPLYCYEKHFRREGNLELPDDSGSRAFGSRMHALLAEYRNTLRPNPQPMAVGLPLGDYALESEAQATFAGYLAHWPVEPFDIVDVERNFAVSLGKHVLEGKIDAMIRRHGDGKLGILETKTEKRGGLSNLPEAWASRSQIGLYQWAAEIVYQEPVEFLLLDVITRQSEKGRVGADFRRDPGLQRTQAQREEAVRNIEWVADQIESHQRTGFWPADRNACKRGWQKCDFYQPHLVGWSDQLVQLYRPAERYLGI